MKNLFLLVFSVLSTLVADAQTTITGKVTDRRNKPIVWGNVYIKGTTNGNATDENGGYKLLVNDSGKVILGASYLGYETVEKEIVLTGGEMVVNLQMKPEVSRLEAVTISAGAMEASDEKKGVVMTSLDIVTTAGSNGDITSALQTLPGTQTIGEQQGLFVRGGDGRETKTFIDGMMVPNPYFSGVPDVSSRGRFSPFLFKGTIFSTGGYSAEYGQALSSALILNTNDLPKNTSTTVGLMSMGGFLGRDQLFKNKKTSIAGFVSFIHMGPYFKIVPQELDWKDPPQIMGANLTLRQKIKKTGMFKYYLSYDDNRMATALMDTLNQPRDPLTNARVGVFDLNSQNIYMNMSYRDIIAKKWSYLAGVAYSNKTDDINLGGLNVVLEDRIVQGKVRVSREMGKLSMLRFGAETFNSTNDNTINLIYNDTLSGEAIPISFTQSYPETYLAGFVEGDVYLTTKLVSRVGARVENSNYLGQANIAPRLSLAYKTSKESQISFGYGDFYQTPDVERVVNGADLGYEKATHFILSGQKITRLRTVRAEVYYKRYDNLIKTGSIYADPSFQGFYANNTGSFLPIGTNDGDGYARGFELFWRDKKTMKYTDYWISYSFVDTKREYWTFPTAARPTFAAAHTVSVVYKRWIPKLRTYVGGTYTMASGRPYFNPENPEFLGDRTPPFYNISMNLSYIGSLWDYQVVYFGSVNNIFGFDNVYGYRYSPQAYDSNGHVTQWERQPIRTAALRTVFIGVFMNIGRDGQDDR